MGASPAKGGERPEDFASALDFGPQRPAVVPENTVFSFESVSQPTHFLRHRDFEVWADPKGEKIKELHAFDASFTLIPGLFGCHHSLRAANFPLHYVRHRDSKVYMSEYDGSETLRGDATFEIRRAEFANGKAIYEVGGEDIERTVCFMSVNYFGKYLHVDKDSRVTLEKYSHPNRAAYCFRLTPGFALAFDPALGEPLVYDENLVFSEPLLVERQQQATPERLAARPPPPEPAGNVSDADEAFTPSFSLPRKDSISIEETARAMRGRGRGPTPEERIIAAHAGMAPPETPAKMPKTQAKVHIHPDEFEAVD